jgi:hypothetical protein
MMLAVSAWLSADAGYDLQLKCLSLTHWIDIARDKFVAGKLQQWLIAGDQCENNPKISCRMPSFLVPNTPELLFRRQGDAGTCDGQGI